VIQDNSMCDREPQASSAAASGEKRFEDSLEVLFGEASAAVFDHAPQEIHAALNVVLREQTTRMSKLMQELMAYGKPNASERHVHSICQVLTSSHRSLRFAHHAPAGILGG
jgi:hypothetical protein